MKALLALLALASASPAKVAFIAHSRTVHPSVEVANLDGSDVQTLGPGGNAQISPDGSSVAAVEVLGRSQATSELLAYPVAGGAARKLAHFNGFVSLMGWSADSQLLLVYGPLGVNGAGALQIVNVASGVITRIATGAISGASFAPSGDEVVYARASSLLESAQSNLYVYDGTSSRQIASDAQNPLWGPQFIVFVRLRSRGSQYAPIGQLWAISPQGTGARQLTHVAVGKLLTGLTPVAFSADGKHLLCVFEGTDTAQTWTVDLSGPQAVAHELVSDESVPNAISRDGSEVLVSLGFEGTPPSLEMVPWAGGTPTVIAAHGYGGSWDD